MHTEKSTSYNMIMIKGIQFTCMLRIAIKRGSLRLSTHLQTDTAFIVPRIWSALVFSLKTFVQTDIAYFTVE